MSTGTLHPPVLPIGKIKTFGTLGPKYEIMGSGHPAENGDWLVPIRVVESGEELDYRYSRLILDPDAL
jgi:hypothetical protein